MRSRMHNLSVKGKNYKTRLYASENEATISGTKKNTIDWVPRRLTDFRNYPWPSMDLYLHPCISKPIQSLSPVYYIIRRLPSTSVRHSAECTIKAQRPVTHSRKIMGCPVDHTGIGGSAGQLPYRTIPSGKAFTLLSNHLSIGSVHIRSKDWGERPWWCAKDDQPASNSISICYWYGRFDPGITACNRHLKTSGMPYSTRY